MIEEVKRIFDDIRNAIIEMGGNIDICTSPEDYDEAIKTLAGNNAVLFLPVFKQSDTKPAKPTKQMSSNEPTEFPDGWGTPDGLEGSIGMSYTIVGPNTTYIPWTEPLLINGIASDDGGGSSGGEETKNLEAGSTRTFNLCAEGTSKEIIPKTPAKDALTWNVVTNILEGDFDVIQDDGYPLTGSTDNNHISGLYTWFSSGTFLFKDGSLIGDGTEPICINGVRDGKDGKDGRNGVDGEDIEFIYKLCKDKNEAESLISLGAPYSDPNQDDYQPTGGTDQPYPGIDPINYRVQLMCTRKKNVEDPNTHEKTWGPFVGPVVGSSWGEDGMDGDGIEYIFRVAAEDEVNYVDPEKGIYELKAELGPPTCAGTANDGCASGYISTIRSNVQTSLTDDELFEIYNQDEFIPATIPGHIPNASAIGWDRNGSDDPLDVSYSKPYEFCSIRKYDADAVNTDGSLGKGTGFTKPVLWNRYGGARSPVFSSFVFTRSRLKLGGMTDEGPGGEPYLKGGTVGHPYPDSVDYSNTVDGKTTTERIVWFDTVPTAQDFDEQGLDKSLGVCPVGMTTRLFGSIDPDAELQDQGWSSPTLVTDNKYFQVEYSGTTTINPNDGNFRLPRLDEEIEDDTPFLDPNNETEGIDEAKGRQFCVQHGLGVGGDENDIEHPIWMATCQFLDGKWTEWNIVQIKGEDGATIGNAYAYTNAKEGYDLSTYTVTGVRTIDLDQDGIGDTPIPTTTTKPAGSTDPTTYVGHDSFPSLSDGEVHWEVVGKFEKIDNEIKSIGGGSKPRLLVDRNDFEIMTCPHKYATAAEARAAIPSGFSKLGVDIEPTGLASAEAVGGFDEQSDYFNKEYLDDQRTIPNPYYHVAPIYKAENHGVNNVFSDNYWVVTKCEAEDGKNGDFTSFVYTSAEDGIDLSVLTLTGGTCENPIPNKSTLDGTEYTGQDAPPNTSKIIGEAQARFVDEDDPQCKGGSRPRRLKDTIDFEVMYSAHDYGNATPVVGNGTYDMPPGFKKKASNSEDIDPTWQSLASTRGGYDETSDLPSGQTAKGRAQTGMHNGVGRDGQFEHIGGEKGDDGRGVVSTTNYYMGSANGTTHPSESSSSWKTTIATFDESKPYLWTKIIITYTDNTSEALYSVSRQGKDGDLGPTGAKLRMRNGSTTYTNPDSDGQIGGLSGRRDDPAYDENNPDEYYDIAIGPIKSTSITIQNAGENAPKLGLCKKRLTYTNVASLVQTEGAAKVYPGSTALQDYFVQAQGWDFLATNVLLANYIAANDIEAGRIDANELHTNDIGEGHIDIVGNDITLTTSDGAKGCTVSGDPIIEISEYSGNNGLQQTLGRNNINDGGNIVDDYSYSGRVALGNFTVNLASGDSHTLTFESGLRPGFTIDFYADVNTYLGEPVEYEFGFEYKIYAKNTQTGEKTPDLLANTQEPITVGTTSGGPCEVGLSSNDFYLYATDPGNILRKAPNISNGNYTLYFEYSLYIQSGSRPDIEPKRVYLNQDASSLLKYEKTQGSGSTTVGDSQLTEIGSNGFQHILDANNYFRVITQVDSNNNKTLMMEFLTNGTQGIQITKDGIKYRNGSNGENLTTP